MLVLFIAAGAAGILIFGVLLAADEFFDKKNLFWGLIVSVLVFAGSVYALTYVNNMDPIEVIEVQSVSNNILIIDDEHYHVKFERPVLITKTIYQRSLWGTKPQETMFQISEYKENSHE